MAVQHKHRLKQGDCKNAFCQATLPDDEPTIIHPPAGCPFTKPGMFWRLKKSLYGLRCAPRHWFDKITGILKSMGLRTSPHDPCIFHGSLLPGSAPIYIGLYVDYMLTISVIFHPIQRLNLCLRNSWPPCALSISWETFPVHLNQAAFSQFLVDKHKLTTANKSRRATSLNANKAHELNA
eukprot:scaffold50550_cov54-Attheya_sp.AAC.1